METTHYVYVLKSRDGTYYHGDTKDLKKRLLQHRDGESRPTRHKLPLELVYFETCSSKTEAMRRERQIKNGRTRKKTKEKLIRDFPREKIVPFLE
jgi:putative endonuclease